jgi:CRP/FNR family transcriptional activator FtrB
VNPQDRDGVRGLPIFADMAESSFDSLLKAAYLQRFPAQVELITEGEPADFLYVVIDGRVELYSESGGRETTMAMITPVSTFLLAATIKSAPYLMSGRTLAPSRILLVPSVDVRRVLSIDHQFAMSITDELAICYRSVVKSVKNLKLRTSVERVGNYILRLQDKADGATSVVLPVGKRTMASMLGMTPENLSRAFGALQSHGMLVNGPEIEITDRAKLEAYSKPNPLIDDMST